jgi:hypothetical protein
VKNKKLIGSIFTILYFKKWYSSEPDYLPKRLVYFLCITRVSSDTKGKSQKKTLSVPGRRTGTVCQVFETSASTNSAIRWS